MSLKICLDFTGCCLSVRFLLRSLFDNLLASSIRRAQDKSFDNLPISFLSTISGQAGQGSRQAALGSGPVRSPASGFKRPRDRLMGRMISVGFREDRDNLRV